MRTAWLAERPGRRGGLWGIGCVFCAHLMSVLAADPGQRQRLQPDKINFRMRPSDLDDFQSGIHLFRPKYISNQHCLVDSFIEHKDFHWLWIYTWHMSLEISWMLAQKVSTSFKCPRLGSRLSTKWGAFEVRSRRGVFIALTGVVFILPKLFNKEHEQPLRYKPFGVSLQEIDAVLLCQAACAGNRPQNSYEIVPATRPANKHAPSVWSNWSRTLSRLCSSANRLASCLERLQNCQQLSNSRKTLWDWRLC